MTTRDPEATATERSVAGGPRRLSLLAGPAEAIVLVGGILLGAYVFSPTQSFDWAGDLEQFGLLRHQSLALWGLLGLVFLWPVWENATNRLQRAGSALFGIGFVITAGANALAAAGTRAGDWAIIGLVLLFPLALLLYGSGDLSAGRRQRGGTSLFLGGLYLVNLWLLLPLPPAPQWYTIISYVGSFVLVTAWAVLLYLSLRE